ncbi:MAG TPA: hypothetical protein VLU96_03885 [Gaiellaceae bacterium]|nr:hypothetical protein [Gaiellaceae bacterium]
MPPSRLLRLATSATACVALALGTAGSAAAAQSVELLTPADASVVTLEPNTNITYRWIVSWPDAPKKGTTVALSWQLSTDPDFSTGQIVGTEIHTCPVRSYNCWTSFTPSRVYGPQTFYWRVKFGDTYSDVSSFTVKIPDRVKPRVRALSGNARRGKRARFAVRAADDRGEVRFRTTLLWRGGYTVLARSFPFVRSVWAKPLSLASARPLPNSLRPGRYVFCVKAWDRAGNHARSCAPYQIR